MAVAMVTEMIAKRFLFRLLRPLILSLG